VQGDRLSLSLSQARLRFTGAGSTAVLSQLPTFFGAQLSCGALPHPLPDQPDCRPTATAFIALLYGHWAQHSRGASSRFGTEEFRKQFVGSFVNYYSANHSPASFTGQVWTDNASSSPPSASPMGVGVYSPCTHYSPPRTSDSPAR
jgi:hypothetical protein